MKFDLLIVGGGIVGLATAYEVLKQKPDVKLILIEKEDKVAAHQTGNNSGVIHSGLYYKPGGLKATNCLEGYRLLLDFVQQENVPYDLCGKIVVATNEKELPALEVLYNRGIQNGLENLVKIGAEERREIEPHCQGIAGIKVPQTGIVDYPDMCRKLANCIKQMGGEIVLGEKVKSIKKKKVDIKKATIIYFGL